MTRQGPASFVLLLGKETMADQPDRAGIRRSRILTDQFWDSSYYDLEPTLDTLSQTVGTHGGFA